jgi:hypothetical protein
MRKARVKPHVGSAFSTSIAGSELITAMSAAAARLAKGLSWFIVTPINLGYILGVRIHAAVKQK